MGLRDFNSWISGFRDSISDFTYYVDFEKVYRNVESIKIELNILNSLIGSKTIDKDFKDIVARYPETLKVVPILLAVREREILAGENGNVEKFVFSSNNCPTERYVKFMHKTGLFDLLQNHVINNLVDYVTGVETGLDSNGRKTVVDI